LANAHRMHGTELGDVPIPCNQMILEACGNRKHLSYFPQ